MRSGKAVRVDDEAWAKIMQIKGLFEARDSREYSASDLLVLLIDEVYARHPELASALKALSNGKVEQGVPG